LFATIFEGDVAVLNSLKETGKNLGHELSQAWGSLSDGWHELLSRSSNALTRFTRGKDEASVRGTGLDAFPQWSLLAGELEETAKDVWVRVELPGLNKEDCQISIEGNVLNLSGEKHFSRETKDSTYHVMERAYGAFSRSFVLPRNVNVDKAEASFKNGVLTVRLPKVGGEAPKSIAVT
jgi:HSP20 family protein